MRLFIDGGINLRAEQIDHFKEENCLKDATTFAKLVEHNLEPSSTVLDIGTGAGYAAIVAAAHVHKVIASDIDPDIVSIAKASCREQKIENIEFHVFPAEKLNLKDESVDGVTIRYTLHHFDDSRKALAEAYRVLKPAGILIMADAFFPEKIVRFWSILSLLRHGKWTPYFTYRQHFDMLSSCGFNIKTIIPNLIIQYFDDFYSSAPENQRNILKILIDTMSEDEKRLMHFCDIQRRASFAYDGFELVASK